MKKCDYPMAEAMIRSKARSRNSKWIGRPGYSTYLRGGTTGPPVRKQTAKLKSAAHFIPGDCFTIVRNDDYNLFTQNK